MRNLPFTHTRIVNMSLAHTHTQHSL